jgi:filamentous hemagglutinin
MAGNPVTFVDLDGEQDTAYTRYLDRQFATVEGTRQVNEGNRALGEAVLNWGRNIVQGLEHQWKEGTTSDRVEVVATGVGAASGAVPYVGDYVSLGSSVVAFGAKPSWSNAAGVGLDAIGAVLPFIPALGTLKRTEKLAEAAKDAERLAEGAKEAEKVAEATKEAEKLGEAAKGTKNAGSGPVKPGDTGTYGDLKARKKDLGESEALHMDHQPSYAAQKATAERQLGRPLTPDEARALKANTPAVASPRDVHQQTSPTYGGRNNPDRIAGDAADLEAAAVRDKAVFEEAMRKR